MIEGDKANRHDAASGTILQVVESAPNYAVYALDLGVVRICVSLINSVGKAEGKGKEQESAWRQLHRDFIEVVVIQWEYVVVFQRSHLILEYLLV